MLFYLENWNTSEAVTVITLCLSLRIDTITNEGIAKIFDKTTFSSFIDVVHELHKQSKSKLCSENNFEWDSKRMMIGGVLLFSHVKDLLFINALRQFLLDKNLSIAY